MTGKAANIIQFIKFGLVGFSNTLLSEGVYFIVVLLGGNYLAASLIGFILSVLNAYFWSTRYVFKEVEGKEPRVWWKVLAKTYVAYFWGFLANAILLVFWIELIRLERFMAPVEVFLENIGVVPLLAGWGVTLDTSLMGELTAPLLNLVITVPMNYLINKYWAYRQKSA